MGISRDHWHKRRATGGKRHPIRQKRKFELARPAAMTKLGPQRYEKTFLLKNFVKSIPIFVNFTNVVCFPYDDCSY